MTKEEWLAASDPNPMLEFLRGKASDRKLRLFAVGCCRRIFHLLILRKHEPSRKIVDLVEAVADGKVSELRLPDAFQKERGVNGPFLVYHTSACELTACPMSENLERIVSYAALATGQATSEQVEQCRLIRDVFGNPFRPVTLDSSWLTSTVVALAREMYDSRDFSTMPILADALQDAGGDNADVLDHCRQPGEHVRGCFVVDSVLGKS